MSDSSILTKPSIDEPSNVISPSSALSNWLRGTSTFLLTPRMSVNCSRRKSTPNRAASSLMSRWLAPPRSVGKLSRSGRIPAAWAMQPRLLKCCEEATDAVASHASGRGVTLRPPVPRSLEYHDRYTPDHLPCVWRGSFGQVLQQLRDPR